MVVVLCHAMERVASVGRTLGDIHSRVVLLVIPFR